MEFISAEEFLKQPDKVKQTLIDWWVPSIGDLVYIEDVEYEGTECEFIYKGLEFIREVDLSESTKESIIDTIICPLFTEGQLRKFIEYATGKWTTSGITFGRDRFVEIEEELYHSYRRVEVMDKDLLQAYWKYACRTALESN